MIELFGVVAHQLPSSVATRSRCKAAADLVRHNTPLFVVVVLQRVAKFVILQQNTVNSSRFS